MFGGGFGAQEIVLILILVLVLFGAKRIPDIMRGFGQGLREFKEASSKAMSDIEQATSVETKPQPSAPPATTSATPTATAAEDAPKIEPQ